MASLRDDGSLPFSAYSLPLTMYQITTHALRGVLPIRRILCLEARRFAMLTRIRA